MESKEPQAFQDAGFDAAKYINELSSRCLGGSDELNSQKGKLLELSEQTNTTLKKNVFQHYNQFIETAKDISYLASEMYQISQVLRDQRSIIQSVLDTSIIAPPRRIQNTIVSPTDVELKIRTTSEDEERKKIRGVLEKVEGAGEIVEDDKRSLIFEGDLLEIDPDNYSAVQRKRGYLFSDGIMLAVWVTNRRGPQRYKFEAFYELSSVGMVVNIRDPECPKHTFKLLIFPSVHILQCPTQHDKDSWVNHIESRQRIIRNPSKFEFTGKMTNSATLDSPIQENLPGFPSIENEKTKSPESSMGMMSLESSLPEWVLDITEDLDVWIAQRNFTEAVDLYENFQEFLLTEPVTTGLKEIKSKVETRIKQLIDTLVIDLEIMTPEKILQGGPRSIRKSIELLIRLHRENQASKIFLTHRSAYIKQRMKRMKSDGRSQIYLGNLSEIFFSSIIQTMKEYQLSFSKTITETASLIVWVNTDVSAFVTSFCRQLFTPQCHLSSLSSVVSKFRTASQQLMEMGVDLSSIIDATLQPHIERSVTDAKDKLVEAIRHRYRSQEEVELPMRFPDETSFGRTVAEMKQLGINNLQKFAIKEGEEGEETIVLELSSNTLAFSKSWLHFCEDVMELSAPEWHSLIQTAICEVLLFEVPHLEHALNRARKRKAGKLVQMIEKDAAFVLDSVVPAANQIYEKKMGVKCPQLGRIIEDSGLVPSDGGNTSPSRVTKSKYTSPEYI